MSRLAFVATTLVVLALVAGVALWRRSDEARRPRRERTAAPAVASPLAEDTARVPGRRIEETKDDAAAPADPLAEIDDVALAWSAVDLDAVRAALPENLYWKLSAPTKDPQILREREEERDRWNVEYGKVLSNTATAEEVEAYYAQRRRLSNDYVQFATHLLVHYGDKLPKRDVGLLKLAIDMHMARLEEIPRQLAEAHQRREAHDAARRAWLEDQKAFDPAAR
jgi:hypothetical protein